MSATVHPVPETTLGPEPSVQMLRGPVVLAADGRAASDATAIVARDVAAHLGAPLRVVTALQPLPVYTVGYDVPIIPPDFETERKAELHDEVTARLEPVLGSREHWHLDVRYGAAARVIPDAAAQARASLIVIGAGSHRVIDRVLGEEIATQVVRHATTPVLAVAPGAAGRVRRAVVATDFSASSIRAAQVALSLIDPRPDGGGLLTLVHVRSPLEDTPPTLATWAAEYDANVGVLFSRLRDLLRPYVPAGVAIESRLRSGPVVDGLRQVARETAADLIAVGTHGPGWVERLFVGSVAASTLREAETSVLVTPPPNAAERIRLELRVCGQVTLERREDWSGALDTLSRRNLGRRARLEVTDPSLSGFAVEAEHYRFLGATYDPHDRRVEIMLGDPATSTRHLTHGIAHVRSVEIVAEDDRRDRALLVEDAHGHTALTLMD